MNYWDTSCVLKLYTPEPDSAAYLALAGQATEPLLTSEIMASELTFALHQKESRGDLKAGSAERVLKQFHADCAAGRWLLIPLGRDVLVRAAQLAKACYQRKPPVALRTLDGVHLATALLTKTAGLVTTDERMRQAARVLGLALVPSSSPAGTKRAG